jgi:hypothetical protein
MRRLALMLRALPATAALLSACSSGPGPLGNGGVPAQQCVPARQGQTITMGIYELENSGSTPANVQSVSLGSPHGLAITNAWITPIFANTPLIGAVLSWPPPAGPAWAERKEAEGAVINPGRDMNLVLGLTRTTANTGRSDGPIIVYTAGGTTYTLSENTSLIVAAKCI